MKAIQKIHDEHRSLAAVLHGLKQLARDLESATERPSFAALRAMVRYIDEFPEKLHHPKEDRYLFPPLVARVPAIQATVDALRAEHKDGARLVRELERSLMFFEDRWPLGAAEFLFAVDAYAEFHWKHMRKEEEEILPLAEKNFSPGDWEAVERAFDVNRDPIAGIKERDFQELFSRIVTLAPEPVGLGERWKKVS